MPDSRGKPQYGPYVWKSFAEVDRLAQNFAKGMLSMDIAPEIVGEDKTWRFVGIWAKNRWEWTNTLIAGMHYKITTVGFYDAQSEEQIDYIIRQTEMTSVVCTEDYAKRLITMKGKGLVPSILKVILVTPPSPDLIQSASANQIDVFTYDQVL